MSMRILCDENVDRPIAIWLRQHRHDVVEVTLAAPQTADAELIQMSRRENRVLMSFDRDVGRLMRSDPLPHPGIIYLRITGKGPELWEAFKQIWPRVEPVASNHFVTVRNNHVRRRPLPMSP